MFSSKEPSGVTRELYLPIAFVEALGRATIARAQLELSFDVLIAILSQDPSHERPHGRSPLEAKMGYLATLSSSSLLKREWSSVLHTMLPMTEELNDEYTRAAIGSIYSRGAGYFEEIIRPLAAQTKVDADLRSITPSRIEKLAAEFREIALRAAALATSLIAEGDRPSM